MSTGYFLLNFGQISNCPKELIALFLECDSKNLDAVSLPSLMVLIGFETHTHFVISKGEGCSVFVNDDSVAEKKEGLKYLTLRT